MITRLLVANRGEIARRVIRTAAAMGISTVAVYADPDAGAPHVTEAAGGGPVPGRPAAQTYLDSGALLAAAAAAGADAVHPGYGFLSESAGFARAVLAAGLTWVGPPPEVIEALGDKLAAKRMMAEAGVPVLPSWEIADGQPGGPAGLPPPPAVRPAAAAPSGLPVPPTERPAPGAPSGLVFPLMVKAVAGGGGKGMRIVAGPAGLAEAVSAARREAAAAFGDARVFCEPYLDGARHVEIQVLADSHGGAVQCFERECSVQRRHQKIIEECPSPALTADTRERMGAAALAAAKAAGYTGAGTVEFLLAPTGEFWFLEVNTRLQVEHPVTEAVTGLDLVREQLLVAQGLPLSVTQADLAVTGHAIEARLYAEDPAAGFLPATGTLLDWCPAAEPDCRWDSGVTAGSVVGPEFDPLLAKVIAHAPTRTEAALRLALALARSRIRGVTTNRDFLAAALRHPEFLAGRTTTGFVETAGVPLAREPGLDELRTAAVAAALAAQAQERAAAGVLATLPSGWRNTVMPPQRASYRHGAATLAVSYARQRDGTFAVEVAGPGAGDWARLRVTVHGTGGGWIDFSQFPGDGPSRAGSPGEGMPGAGHAGDGPSGGGLSGGGTAGDGPSGAGLRAGGRRHRWHVLRRDGRVWVQGPDGDVALAAVPRFPQAGPERVAGGLLAPMPGSVLAVHVGSGDTVAAGQLLMIVEAMKMEHRVTAPHAGTVTAVHARPGDQVSAGDLLAVIEAAR